MTDDDEVRRLFEQLRDDQTSAGLEHIASTVGQFRDQLTNHGFNRRESFLMSRDMLNALMDAVPFGVEDDDGSR